MTVYRFTAHQDPQGFGCRWSHVQVVAPEKRVRPGNRRCPAECPTSDVETDPREARS
jgi:hypothetical protein